MNHKKPSFAKRQCGAALLEALVAILIFSMGIIALMGLQAVSIRNSIDAKYRADAAYLANELLGQMWVDRDHLDRYAHYPDAGAVCAPGGAPSTYPKVVGGGGETGWLPEVDATLPQASADKQQIIVTPVGTTDTRLITITICWQGPQGSAMHNYVATAQINTL